MTAVQQVGYEEFHKLAGDVGEVKLLMVKMVEALARISLLDERQQTVSTFMQKLDARMERMEARQHDAEIKSALAGGGFGRLEALETGWREIYIDRERDKARIQTMVWMVRALWAVAGTTAFTLIAKTMVTLT
jgi:hypothetical protein